jgi:hypothetical protein
MPSEMRGGGGEPKGGHCFSKKILNPIRLKFERKTFRMTFCKFLPNPSNWRFFVRIFSGKNLVFYRLLGFKIELLPKTQLGHF